MRALKSTRICYLANASDPHTAKWANHFSSKGCEVHVVSFEDARGISPNVVVHKLSTRWRSSLRYFTVTDELKRIIAEVQPALLHAHYAAGYGTLGRLARFHPYILSVWGRDVFDVPTKSPLHRVLIKRNLGSANYVCSTSRFMADHTHQYYKGLIRLTPFGVDCSKFMPCNLQASEPDEFVIGTVKRLEEKYGIEYLIRCFALLSEKYKGSKKLRLVVAGEGSLKGKLQRLARECGVEELTQFLGFVPNERVPQLLIAFLYLWRYQFWTVRVSALLLWRRLPARYRSLSRTFQGCAKWSKPELLVLLFLAEIPKRPQKQFPP